MSQAMTESSTLVDTDKQWRSIYTLGGIATIFVLIGIIVDIIIGTIKPQVFFNSS